MTRALLRAGQIVDSDIITEAEMTTISGDIVAQIPTLSGYATESYVTIVSSDIINYVDNHTWTESDIIDLQDYVTEAEFTTYSGAITAQIPTDFYTTSEVDTISGVLQSELDTHTSDSTIHFTESSIDHENIQNVGTNTHTEIDNFMYNLNSINSIAKERTGFPNLVDSTISFDDGTQTFTISGTSFDYYISEVKYTIEGYKSITISGAGPHFIYLDNSKELQTISTFSTNTLLADNAYCAVLYWDGTDAKHIYFGEERHGILWDWNMHSYHHLTEGTKWQSGLGLTGVSASGPLENIYNADSSLWTMSIISSFPNDFVVSAAQNHTTGGSNSLDFTDSENTDVVQFYKGSYIDLSDYNTFTGWIYITSWGGGDNLSIYGYDTVNDIVVGTAIDLSDYVVEATQDVWQSFEIPLVDMGLDGETVDALRITMVGGGGGQPPSGYLDDLLIHYIPTAINSNLEIGVGSGTIRDEDLIHSISETISGTNSVVVLYKEDAGSWTHDGSTNVFFKNGGSGRVTYNEYNGLIWQQTEVADNDYTLVHIFATNDVEYPIVGVQAERTFSDISNARSEALNDINSIITGDMPFEEFIPIASLIILTSDDIDNDYKATFIYIDESHTDTWIDHRALRGASTGSISISNHANLSNLSYGASGHTGFSPTDHEHLESDITDLDKYTQSEVDNLITTTSGSLQDQIDVIVPGISNIVEDTTPELGGNLDTGVYTISGTGDIYATTYYGDGSNLTGINTTITGAPTNMFYTSTEGTITDTSDMTYDSTTGDIRIGGGSSPRFETNVTDSKSSVYGDTDTYLVISGSIGTFVDNNDLVCVLTNEIQTIGKSAGEYITIDNGTNDDIEFGILGSAQMTINSSGVTLASGTSVSEILDSTDSIDASSTDAQLVTAKLVYDTISTVSGIPDILYEEGTWMATVADASSGGNTTDVGTGYYTKIGNMIHVSIEMNDINTTGLTAGNNLYLQGLPYSVRSTGTHMGSCKLDTVAFSGFVTVQANVSSNALFFVDSSNGISDSILNVSAFSDDTSDLKADVTYFTE